MELLDYLRALKRRWWLVASIALVCLGASFFFTERQPRIYQSSIQYYLSSGNGAPVNNLLEEAARGRISTYLQLANSSAALREAIGSINEPVSLGGVSVSGAGDGTTIFMSLVVTADSPRGAYLLAKGYAATFPTYISQFERTNPSTGGTTLTVQEQPSEPTVPVSPKPMRNYALGLILGLVLGAAAALMSEVLDRSVRSVDEVEKITGLPSLASIPVEYKGETAIAALAPRSQRAEAIRQLRTNVQFAGVDKPLRTLLVTSALPGEGKTTTAVNLAITSALAGQTVALVDADLRRPSIAGELGLEGAVGLTSLVIDEVGLEDAMQTWGEHGELAVLTSGPIPANPSELLGSQRMLEIIKDLQSRYELVIFDTPPVLPVTDATVLARLVDGVILVTKVGTTRRDRLKRATDSLRKLDVRVVGVVSNWTGAIGEYYLPKGETAKSLRRQAKHTARNKRRDAEPTEQSTALRPADVPEAEQPPSSRRQTPRRERGR